MFRNSVIEETKNRAVELLYDLQTEAGFTASKNSIDNYKRVWARDGVLVGLGVLTLDDPALLETFKKTLLTLRENQDDTGRIPSNISLDGKNVSYGTTVGRIDATIWYIVGVCKYFIHTKDDVFWGEFADSLADAIHYLKCLELNGRGLLYIPAGGDWADEYINEGYVLFDQLLYAHALNLIFQITKNENIEEKYRNLINLIKINYFPSMNNLDNEFVYHKVIFQRACEKRNTALPISTFSPFDFVNINDLFAISLLFNLDVLDTKNQKVMEKELENSRYEKFDFPVLPAFSPVIDKHHPRWHDLSHNFLFRFKNNPHEFHNGGLWPLVYGFYLASKDKLLKKELQAFAEILKRDDYVFPEFYHGETFEKMGIENMGYSATGYLLAYYRYKKKIKPLEI